MGKVGDVTLKPPFFDPPNGATALLDLIQDPKDAAFILAGQVFDIVGPAQRIDHCSDVSLFSDDLLSAQGQFHGFLGRNREGLIHAIGVQALGPAQNSGQCLQAGAH